MLRERGKKTASTQILKRKRQSEQKWIKEKKEEKFMRQG